MKDEATSFYNAAENVNAIDASFRDYMVRVFTFMSVGLGITAIIAYFIGNSQAIMSTLFRTPGLIFGLCLLELGVVFYLSLRIKSIPAQQAKVLFYLYSALNGLSLAPLFVVYTGTSIASTFFVTASMFLAMAIYGYTTNSDLTSFGSIMFMALIGLVVASIVNIFLHSETMAWFISGAGVIIFTGLTAYDSQKIKSMYFEGDSPEISGKKAVLGALCLYLDFINLFIYLLKFLGNRRD